MSGESLPPNSEGKLSSAKDKHDFLVSLLKESRSGMIDFMFKQAAVLTLFIGWIISSDDAQRFISGEPDLRIPSVFAIALYAFLFIYWILTYRKRSIAAHDRLVELRFMPAEFYFPLLISTRLSVSLVCAQILLCSVLAILLFYVKPPG